MDQVGNKNTRFIKIFSNLAIKEPVKDYGDDTKSCTFEAVNFKDNCEKTKKAYPIISSINKNGIIAHTYFFNQYHLPFKLISDVEGRVCELYSLWKKRNSTPFIVANENPNEVNIYTYGLTISDDGSIFKSVLSIILKS